MKTAKAFFLVIIAAHAFSLYAEKLILHVDVNKTIIAEDAGNSKTLDDVLIECLAKTCEGCWDSSLTNNMTYVQYVKDYLFPGDKSNREIRRQRNTAIHAFFDVLKKIDDPRYCAILERFEKLKQRVRSQKGTIFSSFFRLIEYLESNGIEYSIILRSFGTDLSSIAQELAQNINLTFEWEGYFKEEKLFLKSYKTGEQITLDTTQEIFTFFEKHGHMRIRDDFKWWNDHHECAEYGKLFPINCAQSKVKTVFFDDNADEHILNPRDATTGCSLSSKELLNKGIICLVDTLQAIESEGYFIDYLRAIGYL